jgi:hypothetical protein
MKQLYREACTVGTVRSAIHPTIDFGAEEMTEEFLMIQDEEQLLLEIILNVGQPLQALRYSSLSQSLPLLKIISPASRTATGRLTRIPDTTVILRRGTEIQMPPPEYGTFPA